MMEASVTLSQFRRNADEHEVCAEYAERWDNCSSKKELVDFATEVESARFLCNAISEGWGISPREIFDRFSPYINGHYISEKKAGYNGILFCRNDGLIKASATTNVIVDCRAEVKIPKHTICRVIADSLSELRIYCPRESKVYVECHKKTKVEGFGTESNIIVKRYGRL